MKRRLLHFFASASLLVGTLPQPVYAQPAPTPVDAQPTGDASADKFDEAQLDALLAPIALYPDALLTQTLMATTSPLDIVAAVRWLREDDHKSLTGAALENALKPLNWDAAVKSLVPFPQVLDTLNSQLDWTQQLGWAMQNQEPDVFASVQRLRLQAQQAGHLQSNAQIAVRTEAPPPPPPVPRRRRPMRRRNMSSSNRRSRTWCMCRRITHRWCTAPGHIRRRRRSITRRRRPIIRVPRWPPGWRSARVWRLPPACGAGRGRTGAAAMAATAAMAGMGAMAAATCSST